MFDWDIKAIPSNFSVALLPEGHRERPPYSAAAIKQVDRLWELEKQRTEGRCFNGSLFAFSHLEESVLFGYFTEYKYYLALCHDPSLAEEQRFCAVGVSGITRCEGKVLLGRRSSRVAELAYAYELAPAGGLSRECVHEGLKGVTLDFRQQLLHELREETAFSSDDVISVSPEALIYDAEGRVIDICATIQLHPRCLSSTLAAQDEEYEELKWLSWKELEVLIEKEPEAFVVTTRKLLHKVVSPI